MAVKAAHSMLFSGVTYQGGLGTAPGWQTSAIQLCLGSGFFPARSFPEMHCCPGQSTCGSADGMCIAAYPRTPQIMIWGTLERKPFFKTSSGPGVLRVTMMEPGIFFTVLPVVPAVLVTLTSMMQWLLSPLPSHQQQPQELAAASPAPCLCLVTAVVVPGRSAVQDPWGPGSVRASLE